MNYWSWIITLHPIYPKFALKNIHAKSQGYVFYDMYKKKIIKIKY